MSLVKSMITPGLDLLINNVKLITHFDVRVLQIMLLCK